MGCLDVLGTPGLVLDSGPGWHKDGQLAGKACQDYRVRAAVAEMGE